MKKAERDVATTTAEMVKPAKRAAAKAPAQKVEEVYLQFGADEWRMADLMDQAKAAYVAEGHRASVSKNWRSTLNRRNARPITSSMKRPPGALNSEHGENGVLPQSIRRFPYFLTPFLGKLTLSAALTACGYYANMRA